MPKNIKIVDYMEKTGLDKFCNQGNGKGSIHYSVDAHLNVLPCYKMTVVNRRPIGSHLVYDLSITEPYSNFIAEGIVTHNCNKLPRMKYADKATWNRARVLPYESTFCHSVQMSF